MTTGDLISLPKRVAEDGVESPALLIVGDVVKARELMAWDEDQLGGSVFSKATCAAAALAC